jgi:membrane protein
MADTTASWWQRTFWETDVSRLPAWKRKPILFVRGFQVLLSDVMEGKHSLHAMGLVYMTILSMVPLLAVSFSVLKGFGVHNQLEPLLLNLTEPLGEKSIEVTNKVLEFVDNIEVGVLGAVGLGVLLYTVISLVSQIETAFNSTWQVRQTRSFFERFSHYISVLLVGPLLIFSAVGLSQTVKRHPWFTQVVETGTGQFLFNTLSIYLPFIMIVVAISFIYIFVPNTRVKPSAALFGAFITALLFKAASVLFTTFIVESTKYTAIYSAFATLILFLIWIYITWLILLLGSSIAFYFQNSHKLLYRQRRMHLSPYETETLALELLAIVTRTYYAERAPLSTPQLAEQMQLPDGLVQGMVERLVRGGFLVSADDDKQVAMPGRPPEETLVAEVLAYVRGSAGSPATMRSRVISEDNITSVLNDAEQTAYAAMDQLSLKQLAGGQKLSLQTGQHNDE